MQKKKNYTPDQVVFIPDMQGCPNIKKSIIIVHPINQLKKKNHMMMSIDAGKVFDKIQLTFLMKIAVN